MRDVSAPLVVLNPAQTPARFGHLPSLDGLRAVSILIVLVSHFVSSQVPGGLGVYVFFVVSGFLIARLSFAESKADHRISLKRFYLRRVLRLYPAIIALTLVVLMIYALMSLPIDWVQTASVLFYFANYVYAPRAFGIGSGPLMPFDVFWSLSVEEHFYLLFPAAFNLLRGRASRVLIGAAAICAVCLSLRLATAALHPELLKTWVFYYHTEFRLDSIAFGVALACLCEIERGRRWIARLGHPAAFCGALALIALCLVVRDSYFRETVRYSILGSAIAVLIAGLLFSPRYALLQKALNSGALVWIGKLSYSLYVWHMLAAELIDWLAPKMAFGMVIPLRFILAFVMAAASYYALERPFAGLRRRLAGRQEAV